MEATGAGSSLDAKDGGIFSYGHATYYGSGVRPDQPATFIGTAPATALPTGRVS